jgi:lipid II:glycine glycyltransferase (peptidoglycan interpeptide bridge formation enzyme)
LPFKNTGLFAIIGRVAGRLAEISDASQWDEFVLSRDEYAITHSWAWGELKGAFGWRPRRFILEENGAAVAGAQVLSRPIPLIGGTLWYAPRGLLVDYDDAGTLAALTEALREKGREDGAVVLKIEPMPATAGDGLRPLGYREIPKGVQPRHTLYLDLTRSEDELLAGMERRTRYNVNYAGRKGVTARAGTAAADLDVFYGLLETTVERKHFLVHNREYYDKVLELFGGTSALVIAEAEGEPLAASFVLGFGKYAYYAHAASSSRRRELKATNRIVWESILWAKAAGYEVFDFWGIPGNPTPDNPLYGVYNFKKGFGGETVEFGAPHDLPLKALGYRALKVALALQAGLRNLRARGTFRDPMGD